MGESRELSFIISAVNKAEKVFDEIGSQVEGLQKKVKDMQPTFKQMALIGTAGFTAITGAIALSVRETMKNEAAQNRLTHILKTSRGATQDQVNVLLKQAEALEKVGVVGAESIVQAQAQLATFDLEAESIERMIPAILDYVVAEKGASASTEDLKQLTNGLAQALNGNFGSLTRTGFVLDDATKELIKNGTEAERTAAIVDVLNSTYKGFNESARNTAEGSLIALRNEFNNLRSVIGEAFLPLMVSLVEKISPVIVAITEWVKVNPELTKWILLIGAGLTAVVASIGLLGLVIPSIITGFTALGVVFGLTGITIIGIVAGLGILILTGWQLYQDWGLIVEGLKLIYQDWFNAWKVMWDNIYKYLSDTWEGIKIITEETWGNILVFFTDTWDSIKDVFSKAIDWILDKMKPLLNSIERVKEGAGAVGSGLATGVKKIGGLVSQALPFADGGIVTKPTLGLVGEAGPEAIIPLSKAGMMGGITVNITGGYYLSEMAANDIGNKIVEKLKRTIKL